MPIKNESFLVLEKSMADRIVGAVRAYSTPIFSEIDQLLREKKFDEAVTLLNSYNPADAVHSQREMLYMIGYQALLFGAREFHATKNTYFAQNGPPDLLDTSTDSMMTGVISLLNSQVVPAIGKLIEQERMLYEEEQANVVKADFVGNINNFAGKYERNNIDLGASLHTNRLSSWGFLVESELTGYTTFTVSAIIDGRTSQVCRILDGKVFHVAPAKVKLEKWLTITNPDDLKNIAPWPGSTQEALAELDAMSIDDLQANGWDTPPYHPYCRTILRKSTEVVQTSTSVDEQILAALAAFAFAPEQAA